MASGSATHWGSAVVGARQVGLGHRPAQRPRPWPRPAPPSPCSTEPQQSEFHGLAVRHHARKVRRGLHQSGHRHDIFLLHPVGAGDHGCEIGATLSRKHIAGLSDS